MAKSAEPKRRRTGGRSARVREAVLKATFGLLTRKGVDDLSISEVAARAGVHETSIYRRWGTLGALIVDACLRYAEDAVAVPDTGSLRSDLVTLIERAAKMLQMPQGQVILALIQRRNPHAQRANRDYWQRRFEQLRPIVDRAVVRGEFPKHADPIVLLQAAIAPIYFRLLVTREPLDDWPFAEVIDRLLIGYQSSSRPPSGRRRKQQ